MTYIYGGLLGLHDLPNGVLGLDYLRNGVLSLPDLPNDVLGLYDLLADCWVSKACCIGVFVLYYVSSHWSSRYP